MKEVAIGEVCELINGRAFKPSDWCTEGLPIVRIQNLNNEEAPFNRYKGEVRDRFLIDSGALLFSWSGTPGTSFGAFFWHRGPAVLNQHIFHVLPKNGIDKNYLRYALNGRIQRIIVQAHGGVGLQHITKDKLEATTIPLPSPDRQRHIANLLDKADAIRRKRKETIALTEELLRSAFLEMFGDPVTNPKVWPVKALAKLGRITTGNTPSRAVPDYFGNDIEWIKSDNINTPSHYLTRATEGLSAQGRAIGRTVPAGSTLITCIAGSPDCIGNVALADREVAFNQQINALTPHDGVDYRFLYVLLLVGKRLVQAASTNGMKGMVSKGKLEDVLVPSPPPEAQAQFGEAFDRVLRLSHRQEVAQPEAQMLFDTIVQRAFYGELAL